MLLATRAAAQTDTIINQQSIVVQAGVGLGGYGYANGSGLPLLNVSFEKGLPQRLGPGYVGVGGYLGYKTSTYKYGGEYRWTYTDVLLAARGAWHPDFAHSEKLDGYVGLAVGVNLYRFNSTDDDYFDATHTSVLWGGYLGGRYMFTDQLGAYGELGYGLGYLNVGIVYKLK